MTESTTPTPKAVGKRKTSNRYDTSFKESAVALATQEGQTIKDVAQRLGICVDTLKAWIQEKQGTAEKPSSRETRETVRTLQSEIKSLKKEIQAQEAIIDVLKKATAIFSHPYGGDMK